jgi:hypothetical protein
VQKAPALARILGVLGIRAEYTANAIPTAASHKLLVRSRYRESGRVAPEGCYSEAPTDPDMRDYRIRLFSPRLSYVTGEGRMRGCGKG